MTGQRGFRICNPHCASDALISCFLIDIKFYSVSNQMSCFSSSLPPASSSHDAAFTLTKGYDTIHFCSSHAGMLLLHPPPLLYQPQFMLPSGGITLEIHLHCTVRRVRPHLHLSERKAEDLGHTASTLNVNLNYSRAETLTFFLESEELRLFLFSLRPVCKHCDCRLQCVNVENAYGIVPYFVTLPLSLSFSFCFFSL